MYVQIRKSASSIGSAWVLLPKDHLIATVSTKTKKKSGTTQLCKVQSYGTQSSTHSVHNKHRYLGDFSISILYNIIKRLFFFLRDQTIQ